MAVAFTALQLLTRSARLVGMIAANEQLDAGSSEDALAILNGLLDTLTTQRLTMPATQRNVFTTIDNQSTYTIGPAGDFVMVRPVSIDAANVLSNTATPAFEIPMTPFDDQSYDALTIKDLTAAFPTNYYFNATNDTTAEFFLWPTPTQSATYQVVLYTPTALAQVGALTDSYSLNPGYYRMLYYNLAVELAPAFAIQPRADITRLATLSLADVKRMNLEMMDLDTSCSLPGGGGIYNSYSDLNY